MQELDKILEEIKDELKDIYLDIANNYNISDLQYDGDKVACVASKFRCDAGRRIEKIIRKHTNDGWIPVEKALPEEGEEVLVWYEYFRYGDYNCVFQTYGIGYQYDGHWSGDVNGRKARCISWQPLPESYRPERSEK